MQNINEDGHPAILSNNSAMQFNSYEGFHTCNENKYIPIRKNESLPHFYYTFPSEGMHSSNMAEIQSVSNKTNENIKGFNFTEGVQNVHFLENHQNMSYIRNGQTAMSIEDYQNAAGLIENKILFENPSNPAVYVENFHNAVYFENNQNPCLTKNVQKFDGFTKCTQAVEFIENRGDLNFGSNTRNVQTQIVDFAKNSQNTGFIENIQNSGTEYNPHVENNMKFKNLLKNMEDSLTDISSPGLSGTILSTKTEHDIFVEEDELPFDEVRTKYYCTECSTDFLQKNLLLHEKHHAIGKIEDDFSCYIKSINKKPIPIYKCLLCYRICISNQTAQNHYFLAHTRNQKHVCQMCLHTYCSRSSLKRHKQTHSGKAKLLCCFCGKLLDLKYFSTHQTTHTGLRPYSCNVCSKAFKDYGTRNKHVLGSANIKPYKCEVCFKRFTRKSDCKSHSDVHAVEFQYLCSICGLLFKSSSNFRTHSRKMHGISDHKKADVFKGKKIFKPLRYKIKPKRLLYSKHISEKREYARKIIQSKSLLKDRLKKSKFFDSYESCNISLTKSCKKRSQLFSKKSQKKKVDQFTTENFIPFFHCDKTSDDYSDVAKSSDKEKLENSLQTRKTFIPLMLEKNGNTGDFTKSKSLSFDNSYNNSKILKINDYSTEDKILNNDDDYRESKSFVRNSIDDFKDCYINDDYFVDSIDNRNKEASSDVDIKLSPEKLDEILINNQDGEDLTTNETVYFLRHKVKTEKPNDDDIIVEESPKKSFGCNYCIKTFGRVQSLILHKKFIHNVGQKNKESDSNPEDEKDKNYYCPICYENFTESDKAEAHLISHTEAKARRTSKTEDQVPNTLQTKSKSYSCHECRKDFKHYNAYRKHKLNHKNFRFKCETCGKAFVDKYYRDNIHVNVHTGARPYACSVCDSAYRDPAALKKHLYVHSRNKPLKCQFCKMRYSSKSDLEIHLLIHTQKQQPFFCPICQQIFVSKPTFKNHLYVFHEI